MHLQTHSNNYSLPHIKMLPWHIIILQLNDTTLKSAQSYLKKIDKQVQKQNASTNVLQGVNRTFQQNRYKLAPSIQEIMKCGQFCDENKGLV